MRFYGGYALALALALAVGGDHPARASAVTSDGVLPTPPKTPAGLPPCGGPYLAPKGAPRWTPGEAIRYHVDINGFSVGVVDFKIERRGRYQTQEVTEYRSLFKLDSLVATFIPIEGRAASLVPVDGYTPTVAMNRYSIRNNDYAETVHYRGDGAWVASERTKNGQSRALEREFSAPVGDFLSAFYMLRVLPADSAGCAIIYGNQRAYTLWLTPDGPDTVETPVGKRPADRYRLRYGSEKSRKPYEARVWLGRDAARLPYRAEIIGKDHLEARIHLYEAGQ